MAEVSTLPDGIDLQALAGATRGERMLLAANASARIAGSLAPMSEVCAMAERALSGTALLDDVGADSPQFWNAWTTLVFGEHFEQAEGLLQAALADARRRGSLRGYGHCLCFGSPLKYRLGRLAEAAEDARQAVEIFQEEPLVRGFALSFLLDALIDQGRLKDARAAADEIDLPSDTPQLAFATILRSSHARLLRVEGNTPAAVDELSAVADHSGDVAPVFFPWRAEAALALSAAGEHDRAQALAAEEVVRAKRVGSRWALAIALGALASAEQSLEPLEQAETLTRGTPLKLERARVLVALGAGLRQHKRTRDATPHLREGLELADRAGAAGIAERARDELAISTGSRPRRARLKGADALTASELRVCRMAAEGNSNREIAQALFVSLRTVETHLTHAYQKLEVSSRGELAEQLNPVPRPTFAKRNRAF